MKKLSLLGSALLLLGATQTNGQEADQRQLVLPQFTVSVTRTAANDSTTAQSVTIITKSEIQQTGATEIADVLKKVAGLDVVQYPGMLSGVGIRGFRPQTGGINQKTLVLINGRPSGSSNISLIGVNNIEKIEILKGASSALYGSQAMGGVINIITTKSTEEITGSVGISYGSYDTKDVNVAVGGDIIPGIDFDLGINHHAQTNNISYGNGNLFRDAFDWNTVNRSYYNSAYQNQPIDSIRSEQEGSLDGESRHYTKQVSNNVRVRLGADLYQDWRLDISASGFRAEDVQSPGDNTSAFTSLSLKNPERNSFDARLTGSIGENHHISLTAYSSNDFSDYRSVNNGVPSDFVTYKGSNKWQGILVQDNFTFKNGEITFGLDNTKANAFSESFDFVSGEKSAPYNPDWGIYSNAAFAQVKYGFFANKLVLNAGARAETITFDVLETELMEGVVFGQEKYDVLNKNFGLVYNINKGLRFRASMGEAFVTPEAYKVAGYSTFGAAKPRDVIGNVSVTYGNPELKPEESVSTELGFDLNHEESGLQFSAALFNTAVKNKITSTEFTLGDGTEFTADGDTITGYSSYRNADGAKMNGMDLSISFPIWQLANGEKSLTSFANFVAYFDLNEEVKSSQPGVATYNKPIQNVANKTATFGLQWNSKKIQSRLSGRYVGTRFDTDFNDWMNVPIIEYAPFLTVDFSISYKIHNHFTIGAQVNNLTDENYYEKRGFNLAGRNANLKLQFLF
ncbi:MAG: vitamin B12 transporter [Sphingobacteriales bacterium]|jgi:vitamin B12 transporter